MRKFIKSSEFKLFVACALLSFVHLFQYFDSGYNINCIVRCVLIFVCGLINLIIRHNIIFLCAYIIGCMIMHLDTFNNYSVFFLVYILYKKYPAKKFYIFGSYILNIFIVCQLHDKSSSHLLIHFLTCAVFFFLADKSNETQALVLSDDETKILSQLVLNGRTTDDVDGYSKATVMRKLEDARLRNNLSDNKILKDLFKQNIK